MRLYKNSVLKYCPNFLNKNSNLKKNYYFCRRRVISWLYYTSFKSRTFLDSLDSFYN